MLGNPRAYKMFQRHCLLDYDYHRRLWKVSNPIWSDNNSVCIITCLRVHHIKWLIHFIRLHLPYLVVWETFRTTLSISSYVFIT